MSLHIKRHASARAFLEQAEPWLLEDEVANNLTIGIARAVAGGTSRYESPLYFATAEEDGQVVGCAFRTPPHKLAITRFPVNAVPELVRDAAQVYDAIPAVHGPREVAFAAATAWCGLTGNAFAPGSEQRVFGASSVQFPEAPPPGQLRKGTMDDLALVQEWSVDFLASTGLRGEGSDTAERLISDGSLYIWEDGGPCSMLAAVGPTANTVRIGYVYTPPGLRGLGYASIATASLTARELAAGRRFCVLYTDLANPTSNSIYRKVGYEPVADVMDVDIIDRD